MNRRAKALLVACAVAAWAGRADVEAGERVILLSWDGAGYAITSRMLDEGKLGNLQRLVAEGAWSDGMVTSFPTKTAAAHAMIYTGRYGHQNGITGNALLRQPKQSYTRLETESGYFSGPLRADPLWVLAARAGRTTYSFHATQQYPFEPFERALGPEAWRRVFLAHGYTGRSDPAELLDVDASELEPPGGEWRIPEARGTRASAFTFDVGDVTFHGLLFDDPFDPTVGLDTLGVVRERSDTSFVARLRAAGPSTSAPVATTIGSEEAWFTLSVLELSRDGTGVRLLRSGAAEVAVSNEDFPGRGSPALEAFAGNGATSAYARGDLGPRLIDGGEGSAEDRLLDSESRLMDQLVRQARLALTRPYDVVNLYSPVTDDLAHRLVGLLDPAMDSYDERRARLAWEKLTAAFEIQDHLLGVLMDEAARTGAHVLLVSDHGMTATDRLVHLNVVLKREGLLALGPDGDIDLSATKALALPLSDLSIAVNTVDRKGGIVPLEDKDDVLRQLRRVFTELLDPDTGEHVVTAVLEPSTEGLVQPGGPGTGDLFVELAPRYYPSTSTKPDLAVTATEPEGNHIFLPTRREMLAILGAWGPRVPGGVRWPRVRAVDVVPTVLDILEIDPPKDLPGGSLLPPRALLAGR